MQCSENGARLIVGKRHGGFFPLTLAGRWCHTCSVQLDDCTVVVAERAFSRCVATNKGKGRLKNEEEVHDHSRKLEVEFKYEFLEDFQDKQSSDFLAKLHSLPAMSMSTPHRRFWTQDNDQHIAKAAWLTTTASSR